MRFYMSVHTIFVITLLFFTAFSLTLTDPKVREILRSDGLPQPDHADQQPLEAITHPLPASNPESTHVSIVVAELQAASDAVSPERPIAKMTAVVLATGVLFGLGMGL